MSDTIDPIEACRKHIMRPGELPNEGGWHFIDQLIQQMAPASLSVDLVADLCVRLERAERTIRDREAELLRCRTHENVAAVTLDKTLNREQRDALKVACDRIAELEAVLAKELPPPGRELPLSEAIDQANGKYGEALRRLED